MSTTTLSRDRLRAAAKELVAREGPRLQKRARHFSICQADAEDAYQRSFEILISKAPTCDLDELLPWMLTVVKREALAIRRQRERLLHGQSGFEGRPSDRPLPDELSERSEMVSSAGSALLRLKSQESRCLVLKAKGYSYNEIAGLTGYSWTKVNRSIAEGRSRLRTLLAADVRSYFEPIE